MINKQAVSPAIPAMTRTFYHLMYRERCTRGGWPQGEGDILLLHGADMASPLRVFLPLQDMAERVFAPAPAPDTVLLESSLRQHLLMQHLEKHGFELCGYRWNLSQITLASKDETVSQTLTDWCYGVPSSLGRVVLCMADNPQITLADAPLRRVAGYMPEWRLPLQLRVGWSSMPLSQLHQLEQGDVVLVTRRQQYLTFSGSCIGQWKFDEEGIVMDRMETDDDWMFEDDDDDIEGDEQDEESDYELDDDDDEDDDNVYVDGEGSIAPTPWMKMQDIETTLEISLGKAGLRLSQAMALQAGDFVPLTYGGLKATRLRLGSQTLAKGELVEIDGQLGVILNQIYFRPAGQP